MSMPVSGRELSQSSWMPIVLGRGMGIPSEKNPVKDWDTTLMERAHSLMDSVQASVPHKLHLSCGETEAKK